MFFYTHKFNYVSFNGSMTPCGSNIHINPNMEILSSSRIVLDLGIYMSGDAHNFSNPITSTFSERRAKSCVISHGNVGRLGTLAYNSFRWRSIHLFNGLPIHLRSISSWSELRFKTQLVIFLESLEDLPSLPGFNNSLDDGDFIWQYPVMVWLPSRCS